MNRNFFNFLRAIAILSWIIMSIYVTFYRFFHPELTETQLFLWLIKSLFFKTGLILTGIYYLMRVSYLIWKMKK